MESETSPLEPRASVSGVEHNGTALPHSPLARSDWDGIVMGTLAELSELAGSEALATGFNPEVTASDSDYELDDGWEQCDFRELQQQGEHLLKEEVRQFLAQQRRRLASSMRLRPRQILLRDKVTFVLGTLDLWLSAYWLGWSPQSFYKLYTVKAVVLFASRWVHYRLKRWHYYLFDFCYFAQVVLLLHVWVYPTSITLTKVSFAFNFGPLLWSVIAFRNSLVYHSVDKVTSHFLHWFPACVSWASRWHPRSDMLSLLDSSPKARARWEGSQVWELTLLPLLPYMCWAAMYYAKVFIISSSKIQQKGYDTLFKLSTKSRRSLFGWVVLRFPQRLQPVVYMLMHVLLSLLAMLFNTLWWNSYTACTAFVLGVFVWSAWNGATFYFDVFAHRYVSGLGLERGRRTSGGGGGGGGGVSARGVVEPSPAADAITSTASYRRKAE